MRDTRYALQRWTAVYTNVSSIPIEWRRVSLRSAGQWTALFLAISWGILSYADQWGEAWRPPVLGVTAAPDSTRRLDTINEFANPLDPEALARHGSRIPRFLRPIVYFYSLGFLAKPEGELPTTVRIASSRASVIADVTAARNREAGPKAGIALSGGGYRAALFHAGVLDQLAADHVPLRAISAVSGGAIIGAFYAAGGTPDAFVRAVGREHRFHLPRDIFDIQNLSRLLLTLHFPGSSLPVLPIRDFTRTDIQANLLDRVLYHGRRMLDLTDSARPELMIAATDLSTRTLVGFTPMGTLSVPLVPDTSEPSQAAAFEGYDVDTIDSRIADVVATSGAFPVVLPAVRIDGRVLVDGGVGDNTGLALLTHAREVYRETRAREQRERESRDASARDRLLFTTPILATLLRHHDPALDLGAWDLDVVFASDGSILLGNARGPSWTAEDAVAMVELLHTASGTRLAKDIRKELGLPLIVFSPITVEALAPDVIDPNRLDPTHPIHATTLGRAPYGDTLATDSVAAVDRLAQLDARSMSDLIALLPSTDAKAAAAAPRRESAAGIVARSIAEWVRAFARTTTLDDRVAAEDAEAISRLGRALVILKRGDTDRALRSAGMQVAPHAVPRWTGGGAN